MAFWRRILGVEASKSELDAEIEAHLAMAAADKRERGKDAEAARREACREFGNVALVKDVTRQAWGWSWLEQLGDDLKYALRQIRKAPGFAAAVIGTLALGIAATAAMFTVVDHVLLQPLPYADAGRLVEISDWATRWEDKEAPYQDIAEWRKWSKSFEGIGFYGFASGRSFMEGKTATAEVNFYKASTNLFAVLGVRPAIGRDFRDDQEGFAQSANTSSVVLSDSVWRSMFGADSSVLGKTVKINGVPYVVAGIMPRGFSIPYAPDNRDVWTLVQLSDKDKGRADRTPEYTVVGRLKKDVSINRAQAELTTLQAQIAKGYVAPEEREKRTKAWVVSFSDLMVEGGTRKALEMLLAASAVLWLIACVNATNLLLARAMARRREVAMRGALGASRWRIVQQFVVEGLMLSGCAAVLGSALALLAVKLFAHEIKHNLPFPVPLAPDGRMVAALLGLTVISALISTAWPALLAAHAPIEPALRQGGQQSGGARGQNRARGALVIVEIALSLTLLVGCGLLLRTIYALRHVPLGFRTDHILIANLEIPGYKFTGENMTSNLYAPLLERIKHLPGVQAAGLMSEVPLGKTFQLLLGLKKDAGQASGGSSRQVVARLNATSPELQKVFGFKMLAGRFFNEQDTAPSTPVLVVNRAFASAYSPGQDLSKIVGMQLWHITLNKNAKVIGVLDDMHQRQIAEPSQPEVEVSLSQVTPESSFYQTVEGIAMDIAVRTERDPKTMIAEIREVLRQSDPVLAESNFTTMDQVVEDSYGSQQMAARLLEVFAGSALLLCVAGLYGLLAYLVSQRTREMGVRFALGAARGDVVWLVMRQAGVLVASGVAIGLVLAWLAGRLVRSYLYGVGAHDGWTLSVVAVVLILSGALAAYLPARRAAAVNPVEALRAE